MIFPCWMLDLRTSAAVQIAKNGPVYKMKTDISFFLRCSVSWALLQYFLHQETFKISLLYLKKKSVIEQWSAIKSKGLLWQALSSGSSPTRWQRCRLLPPCIAASFPASQHHFLPQELLPRWRAKILGGWHVEASGMTLHDIVWCLRKNTRNNKKPPTTGAHIHTPQQFVRILPADTIPYLPPKLGTK